MIEYSLTQSKSNAQEWVATSRRGSYTLVIGTTYQSSRAGKNGDAVTLLGMEAIKRDGGTEWRVQGRTASGRKTSLKLTSLFNNYNVPRTTTSAKAAAAVLDEVPDVWVGQAELARIEHNLRRLMLAMKMTYEDPNQVGG